MAALADLKQKISQQLQRTVSQTALKQVEGGSPASIRAATAATGPGTVSAVPANRRADRAKRREEALSRLPEGYFAEEFDSVLFELQQLQTGLTESDLDSVVDARASVLEVWSLHLVCLCSCVLFALFFRAMLHSPQL